MTNIDDIVNSKIEQYAGVGSVYGRCEVNKLRWAIIKFLWLFPWVSSNYCWAAAVTWSLGWHKEIKKADHKCFYCLACHTDDEIKIQLSGGAQ